VSLPARVALGAFLAASVSLTVASLALVGVVPGWGVLLFYVLPSLFFLGWGTRELAPGAWRRTATPLRRTWRQSPLSGPTAVPKPPPAPLRSAEAVFATGVGIWIRWMRVLLELLRSPLGRRVFNVVFGAAAVAIVVLVARRFHEIGWPLASARPEPAAASAAFFISTFALRALGWQRLFRPFERPRSVALVASNGTAAVAAIALPSRIDDAIAIAVVRKVGRRMPSVGTLALSLFLLGLMDMAALIPFSAYAIVAVRASFAVRLTMAVLTFVGTGAFLLAAALPSIRRYERLTQFRLGHWLAVHAPSSRQDAVWSWLLVAASWLARISGIYVLFAALDLHVSFALATAYVVAGAGAAALPVGPAGAATQAGVGAAILAGGGIETNQAIAVAVAAQALTVGAGAVLAAYGGAVFGWRRYRIPATGPGTGSGRPSISRRMRSPSLASPANDPKRRP
jgi:uncharacterized membrane protein YbhN (UPF0104 family)